MTQPERMAPATGTPPTSTHDEQLRCVLLADLDTARRELAAVKHQAAARRRTGYVQGAGVGFAVGTAAWVLLDLFARWLS